MLEQNLNSPAHESPLIQMTIENHDQIAGRAALSAPLPPVAGCIDTAYARRPGAANGVDPLYLSRLGARWHFEREPAAGWELLEMLRSGDRDARMLAAELLAKTEHGRVLGRDLRKAKARLRRQLPRCGTKHEEMSYHKASAVNAPYGMEIVESCMACKLRKNQWFCGLSPAGLKSLGEASHIATYPAGAVLFVEGQSPRGVYVLCSGRAKLSTTSRDGKMLILKIASAGEVLGLSAAISGQPFEMTAETVEPCQVNFIERMALLERIEKNGELGLRSSLALSKEFQSAYRDIHDLVLARSSAGKLARLLLSWMPHKEKSIQPATVRLRPALTHEEMAQMIGSSRETVTRLMGDLRRKDLIRLDGPTLVIQNRTALEALAS
jgi:CRP/FNR family transcriptional regulator, cyclic AMP receptor protein